MFLFAIRTDVRIANADADDDIINCVSFVANFARYLIHKGPLRFELRVAEGQSLRCCRYTMDLETRVARFEHASIVLETIFLPLEIPANRD